jgi:hypothetical protein
MQRNQMLMAQQPAQIAPSAREFIKQVAKDTAALPNVCGVGVAGYAGNRVAAGLSADTQGGVQFASGANILTVPGPAGFGGKVNYTISGGAAGNVSYQGYALGGAVGVEVGTKDGDPNATQSVSLVGKFLELPLHIISRFTRTSVLWAIQPVGPANDRRI